MSNNNNSFSKTISISKNNTVNNVTESILNNIQIKDDEKNNNNKKENNKNENNNNNNNCKLF